MESRTHVDSVGIKLELNSGNQQRQRLKELNSYINSINGLNVIIKERVTGFGAVILDYHIYYKNETVGVIKTGAYKPDKSKEENIYWVGLVVAGLQSYNEIMDEVKYNFLLTVCSWCTDKRIPFRLCELDTNIDIDCPYINFYSIQIKKAPRSNFNPSDEQFFDSTRYFQKKPRYKSYATAALDYDKQLKEGLNDFVSRHEVKFSFKKEDVVSFESIRDKILSGYGRYAVFYFEDIRVKDQVMRAEFQIENSNSSKAREYRRLVTQLEDFRLYPNIDFIMNYIVTLFNIKNYKMVIADEENHSSNLVNYNQPFDFDAIFSEIC